MDHSHHHHNHPPARTPVNTGTSKLATYRPLMLVLGGIIAGVLLIELVRGSFEWMHIMRMFMGLFFLTFAAFKLMDLKGFASAYAEYDIIANHSRAYAFAYPFIEVALGIAYLIGWQQTAVNIITIILLGISSIGVLKALLNKNQIRCACLGAVVKLPMTTVTLIEDLGMVVMAALMLVIGG